MKDKVIRVRLTEEQFQKLKALADKEETTMSELIRQWIRRSNR